ncbi:hypothetical protein ES703_65838 [subsurface metagenome]
MKEIRDLKSTQILIFPIDEIGFSSLQRPDAIKQLQDKYRLKYNPPMIFEGIPAGSHSLLFTNGEFRYENKSYLIERINIEDRRIIIRMASHSKIVDIMFDDLRKLLIELDLRESKPKYEPLVKAEETSCVVKLDFSFTDLLINSPLSDFNAFLTDKMSSHDFEIEIIPSAIRFKITYSRQPESFRKHKISLSEKDFVLEVRDRTAYEEQLYYTFSPTNSKLHFEFLKELERRVTQK